MAQDSSLRIDEIAGEADMDAAFAIRNEVFCIEQKVDRDEEFDGRDDQCRHYLARLDGRPVGAARIRVIDDAETKIERVAVLADLRGQGIGRVLMERTIADVAGSGTRRIVLNAQCHAETFYAALGFVTEGGVFDEAGIPHVRMVQTVQAGEPRDPEKD